MSENKQYNEAAAVSLDDVRIYVANTLEDYLRIREFRAVEFVYKNGLSRDVEFGDNEFGSTYILAVNGAGKTVGMIGYEKHCDFVRFKRLAVDEDYRKSGLAQMLNLEAVSICRADGYEKVYGVCDEALLDYHLKHGYKVIEGAPKETVGNMTLVPIMMTLDPYENRLKMTDPPSRVLAQEGRFKAEDNKSGIRGTKGINDKLALILRKRNEYRST